MAASYSATPRNQWFVPGAGIAREVITADVQRYLGPDALVRPGVGGPGEHAGQHGYWITAYRTLTSTMIEDLKLDSQRWQQERPSGASGREYSDSATHRARQYHGPTHPYGSSTAAYDQYAQAGYEDSRRGQGATQRQGGHAAAAGYGGGEHQYVAAPTQTYGRGYTEPNSAVPRNQTDAHAAYYAQQQLQQQQLQQQQQQQSGGRGYQQGQYPYQAGAAVDAYGRPTPAPSTAYATPSPANSTEYYIGPDGRQYQRPTQQQAAQTQNPQTGATGYTGRR